MIKNIKLIIFLTGAHVTNSISTQFLPEISYKIHENSNKKIINQPTPEHNQLSQNVYTKKSSYPTIEPKHIIAEENRIKEENKFSQESKLENFHDIELTKQFSKQAYQSQLIEKSLILEDTKNQEPKIITEDKNFQNLFNPLTNQKSSLSINTAFEIPDEVFENFDKFINKMTMAILKQSSYVSPHTKISQVSFSEIIAESLKKYLFLFLRLPYKIKTSTNIGNALNNFRMEIQFLSKQINNYNGKKYYTQPEQMLMLIKIINKFLKEVDAQNISREISIKFDTINKQAAILCALFQGKNIIFSTEDTPKQIFSFFQTSIKNANTLTQLQFDNNIMQIIYNHNGYMDQILQTWNKYKNSDFYHNKTNREYGAFISFLLIFQNSIVAAANILDKTSVFYQITNPIPLVININSNQDA